MKANCIKTFNLNGSFFRQLAKGKLGRYLKYKTRDN